MFRQDLPIHLSQLRIGTPIRPGSESDRRAVAVNSLSGLCITKLDVLDGLETLNICVGYAIDGKVIEFVDSRYISGVVAI